MSNVATFTENRHSGHAKTEQQQLDDLRNAPEYKAYCQLQSECPITREKIAIKNVRILLKKAFPDVKFSVRKKYVGCIWVTWPREDETKDGLNQLAVLELVKPFETTRFEIDDDCPWTQITLFNKVYGGTNYILCHAR